MELMFSQKEVEGGINHLAKEINKDFKHTQPPKIFICLLNGGFMVFSDLVKLIDFDIECDFMRVKSYQGQNQEKIEISKHKELPIKGKDVFIVDDIYDTGNTMEAIIECLSVENPNSINVVALLTRDFSPLSTYNSYYGLIIRGEEWVVGMGMNSDNGFNRNLPQIYKIK